MKHGRDTKCAYAPYRNVDNRKNARKFNSGLFCFGWSTPESLLIGNSMIRYILLSHRFVGICFIINVSCFDRDICDLFYSYVSNTTVVTCILW